jgi:hypothetical protein
MHHIIDVHLQLRARLEATSSRDRWHSQYSIVNFKYSHDARVAVIFCFSMRLGASTRRHANHAQPGHDAERRGETRRLREGGNTERRRGKKGSNGSKNGSNGSSTGTRGSSGRTGRILAIVMECFRCLQQQEPCRRRTVACPC